jgi:hypothetical protein
MLPYFPSLFYYIWFFGLPSLSLAAILFLIWRRGRLR